MHSTDESVGRKESEAPEMVRLALTRRPSTASCKRHDVGRSSRSISRVAGGRPPRRGGARMKRSFPPRFCRARRETCLHYRFLRERALSFTMGEEWETGERWIARERDGHVSAPWGILFGSGLA